MITENEALIYKIVYICLGVITQLTCLSYLRQHENWNKVGRFSECYILLLIFFSEIVKEKLTRFYFNYVRAKSSDEGAESTEQHSFLKRIWYAVLIQLSTLVVYAALCFTFGAPIFHSHEKTFVLALMLTLLTVTPAVLIFGGLEIMEAYFTYYDEENAVTLQGTVWMLVKYNSIGALAGAWTASIVLSLGTNENWLQYPVSNIFGAIMGSLLANVCALGSMLCNKLRRYFHLA